MPLTVATPSVPNDAELSGIRELIARIADVDRRDPLSDQALTRLESDTVEHAIALDGARVLGYAQLDGRSLEIAAEPDAVGPLLDRFDGRSALIWSHGRNSRLAAVLRNRGFDAQRELHQLRRPLTDPIEAPPAPDGIRIAPFEVGHDEDAWLAVNAAAFAHHPEQGSWVRADLAAREREAWFNPSGFLMAWRGDELVGFHWTKVHPDGAGEVYVIAVAPGAQGTGLGAVLLLQGLALLRAGGCEQVLLYVDGDNTGAMRLYERYGFTSYDLDIQWTNELDGAASSG